MLLAILAPVLGSFMEPRISPFAPSPAAFFRWELIMPLSEVTSLPPFEFSTATSVYGLPTLLVSVNTCTPSGQTGASLSDGFNRDRKSTRLNSSHSQISYAVFCLKKKKTKNDRTNLIEHK